MKRFDGNNFIDLNNYKRQDGANNIVDLQYGRRWDGTSWIDIWVNNPFEITINTMTQGRVEYTKGVSCDLILQGQLNAGETKAGIRVSTKIKATANVGDVFAGDFSVYAPNQLIALAVYPRNSEYPNYLIYDELSNQTTDITITGNTLTNSYGEIYLDFWFSTLATSLPTAIKVGFKGLRKNNAIIWEA